MLLSKKLIRFTLFLSVFLFSLNAGSQNLERVDSLSRIIPTVHDSTKVELYIEIFVEYMYVDLDIAKRYADSCIMAAENSGNKLLMAGSRNVLGVYYNMVSDYDSSSMIFNEVIERYEKLGNKERVSAVLNNLANAYNNLGQLEKSLETHMKSLAIKEELGVTGDDLASSYWNIGNVLSEIENFEESNDWYYKARDIYEELNDEHNLTTIKELLAQNLNQMGQPDESFRIRKEVAAFYRKKNRVNDLAGTLDGMGRILLRKGEYEEAEKYLLEALELAERSGEKRLPGYIYRTLSKLYLETNELKKAEKFALLSLENATDVKQNKKKINDYKVLSEIYEKLESYDKAYDNYKKYHILYDTILGIEKIAAMNELEVKYQAEKKEQEIVLLEEKDKRNQLEKKAMFGGIIALLVLFGAIVYGLRQRLRNSKLVREKMNQELSFNKRELDLKKQELTAYALQLAHKNEVLEGIKVSVDEMKKKENSHRDFQKIVNTIEFNKSDDESWEGFRTRFQSIHKDFETIVKTTYPSVTSNELRLMALLKMNLSSKEIANILNVSMEGIKKARYRLRKKLNLESNDSLEGLILSIN